MSVNRKEKLRIAKNSSTPEARIQALNSLLGDDDAYEIFIETLNNRHVGLVKVAIDGLSAYEDSRWEILLDILEHEDFGFGDHIIDCIRRRQYENISIHIQRLRESIPRRQDSMSLIRKFSWKGQYHEVADVLARDCLKYHDFWKYGNCGFIDILDLSHPVSLHIVKRMLFEKALPKFIFIVEKEKNTIIEQKTGANFSNFKRELFGYFSTLVTLSNKLRTIDYNFNIKDHITNLYVGRESEEEIVSLIPKFLEMYLQKKLKTDEKDFHFSYTHGGLEEIFWEESLDDYIDLDTMSTTD